MITTILTYKDRIELRGMQPHMVPITTRSRLAVFSNPCTRVGTVACRGCWMPGANEVLGCPRIFLKQVSSKIFSIRLAKFLTTFFSHCLPKVFRFVQNFRGPFLIIYPNFSHFRSHLSNFTKIRSLDAPQCCIMPR